MDWNFRTDQPIYSQLVDRMRLAIVSGEFAPGQRLPTVRDLAVEAGVNPNTVQRALQELERLGLVFSQRTSGRFVTEDTRLIDSSKHMIAAGHTREFLAVMKTLGCDKEDILALLEEINEEEDDGSNT